jgi:TM2 domain-containing membrane protein YozV
MKRLKVIAGLLGIFLGAFGAHRFYLGYTARGLGMLCLTVFTLGLAFPFTAIWGLVEGIQIFVDQLSDVDGNPLE